MNTRKFICLSLKREHKKDLPIMPFSMALPFLAMMGKSFFGHQSEA